jgi:hypothetical protein
MVTKLFLVILYQHHGILGLLLINSIEIFGLLDNCDSFQGIDGFCLMKSGVTFWFFVKYPQFQGFVGYF